MATKKKSRSGTSQTHAQRLAAGRPAKTFALSLECVEQIEALRVRLDTSRSLVVTRAIAELFAKVEKK